MRSGLFGAVGATLALTLLATVLAATFATASLLPAATLLPALALTARRLLATLLATTLLATGLSIVCHISSHGSKSSNAYVGVSRFLSRELRKRLSHKT
jgi:hypothetical protein